MITEPSNPQKIAPAPFDRIVTDSVTALEWTDEQRRNIEARLTKLGATDLIDMLSAPLLGGAR